MPRIKRHNLTPRVIGNKLEFGPHCHITLHRTLRLPDDGGTYPLPPSLGQFPLKKVSDYRKKVPQSWLEHGGLFFPMYQREAMWLGFSGNHWHPQALKVAAGKINAISGESWDEGLNGAEQDYVVVPDQPWLDGINAGSGMIKQFVAMPLGMGYTVEGQVSGKEEFGGIQLKVYDAVAGRFPHSQPHVQRRARSLPGHLLAQHSSAMPAPMMSPQSFGAAPEMESMVMADMDMAINPVGAEMGLAAGGQMEQSIVPDQYGVDTWDLNHTGRLYIHIVNSEMYQQITGEPAPQSPISAQTYTQHGYPWYSLYNEGDVQAPETLKGVKSIGELDDEHGFTVQDNTPVIIPQHHIKHTGKAIDPFAVDDGQW